MLIPKPKKAERQDHCRIVKPPQEGPGMPTVIGWRAQDEGAALVGAEFAEVHVASLDEGETR